MCACVALNVLQDITMLRQRVTRSCDAADWSSQASEQLIRFVSAVFSLDVSDSANESIRGVFSD